MTGLNLVLIGATILLAGAAIGVTSILSPKNRVSFVYAQLVLMAGVYIGFAIAALDAADVVKRGDWSVLMVESLIAMAFVMAGVGVVASARPWLLGVLILAHGGIDLLHLLTGGAAPALYNYLCVLFDAVAGSAYVVMLGNASVETPPVQ